MTEWLADGVRRAKAQRKLTSQVCAVPNRDDPAGATSAASNGRLGFISVANRPAEAGGTWPAEIGGDSLSLTILPANGNAFTDRND